MEVSDGGGGSGEKKKGVDGGEKTTKRKMKTAFQLDLLEKAYALASYPSEETRAELSAKIGLSDRQLQMWFCHRRLKDRKASELAVASGCSASGSGVNSHGEPRKALARMSAPVASRMVVEPSPMVRNRYYEVVPPPQPTMSETRAISFVESQLGERIREDGPILGVVFDPLPPGAFGAPIEPTGQQKHPSRPYDGRYVEAHDIKSMKMSTFLPNTEHCHVSNFPGGKRKSAVSVSHLLHSPAAPRPVHEYQFLPEQPSVHSDGYKRPPPPHFYDSVDDAPSTRLPGLQAGGLFVHGTEQVNPSYPYQDQMPHIFPSGSAEQDNYPHKNLYSSSGTDAPFSGEHALAVESPFLPPDRRIGREEEVARVERKRKSEESRIAKEVESHEKRIRRELEKQDVMRRKREEQMRREMERHDRERRKEEERMLREKQREEERYQRELRREHERREKFLQKANIRAEKLRLKEEVRREKEAARIKAAHERATARRIAKEYMELIEDERLELMELAASSKGLPSMISLDSDSLQNLHLFRDMLCVFPPKSVLLRRPFSVQPWVNSEENIGNLLMVWKFLITFADVLAVWPFTLDEFIQSLHDFDPRLLGEVHIALLKLIIKDIEDVARTPSVSMAGTHNSAANPGGGHPEIVEGAYAWGFDIRCWQRHLNPLTWPEILRQFALSAGLGPQLKKRSVERAYYRDENEGHDGEDIISTLRSGMAAENALAVMQEKGFSHLRRSRHRLTPGTVKFAAFYVLSLEGSGGLTILEVADRIQRSGLRDLTTSKTPEASIAAALSRDTKLFERTAPSTYCVRSPYRKDPADAEAILAAAREKIHIFENGFSESEEAEKDNEDPERDEASESDGADDPDVDGINTEDNLHSPTQHKIKPLAEPDSIRKSKVTFSKSIGTFSHYEVGSLDNNCSFSEQGLKDRSISGPVNCSFDGDTSNFREENESELDGTEIDESNSGESWVQGLMEGEYSDLSVEERLNAIVSLINVAIEGNTIRNVLEERLEAANSLKKQMWAEAQLDKRRIKDEYMSRYEFPSPAGMKTEAMQANTDGTPSPFAGLDNKCGVINLNSSVNGEPFDMGNPNNFNNTGTEQNVGQELPPNLDGSQPQPCGYVAERSRSQMKSYIGHKAEEIYVYRSLPLGQDRRRNRYWQFVASASKNDPGSGRIFFESRDGYWRLIDSEEAFDALVSSLDTRGIRESHLHSMLQKVESSFKDTIRRNKCTSDYSFRAFKTESDDIACSPGDISTHSPRSTVCLTASDTSEQSSTFKIELGRNAFERSAAIKRYHDLQKWLWRECLNSTVLCAMKYGKNRCPELLKSCRCCYEFYLSEEKHCPSCHKTYKNCHNFDASFTEHVSRCEERRKMDPRWTPHSSDSSLPIRFGMLKALLARIEGFIPSEALLPFWTDGYRKSWSVKLHSSSSAEDLFQLLTLLEGALKRDWLSSNFETTNELLSCPASDDNADGALVQSGSVPVLPWVPKTTAAVTLRLMDLDASISYLLSQKLESSKEQETGDLIKPPSKYDAPKNFNEQGFMETPNQVDYHPEYSWADPGIGRTPVRGRGTRGRKRGRGRGGRGQRGSTTLRSELKEDRSRNTLRTARRQPRGRSRGRGRRRGRRTVRPRQMPQSRLFVEKDMHAGSFLDTGNSVDENSRRESPESSGQEDWNGSEIPQAYIEDDNVAGFSGSDDNEQGSGDEYEDHLVGYPGGYSNKHVVLMGEDSEDDEVNADLVGDANDEVDGDYANEDVEDELEDDDDVGDVEGEETGDFARNVDEDDDVASYSSEYSD